MPAGSECAIPVCFEWLSDHCDRGHVPRVLTVNVQLNVWF